jgi:peptidoglycan/LPS O-acetylase OafA/YrhL
VALFHFTNGNQHFLSGGFLHTVGSYGFSGVEIFFVISGFVVPWSLSQSRYRLSNFWTFLARRITRLDPPYLVSVLIAVILIWASSHAPGFQGAPFVFAWRRLLLHIGYLNGFAAVDWYQPVYWTLAIELQFYIAVGLLYPWLSSRGRAMPALLLGLLGIAGLSIRNELFLSGWIFPFLAGLNVFRWKSGAIDRWEFGIAVALAGIGTAYTLGPTAFVATTFAALAIGFIDLGPHRILEFFGAISYSLYLVHVAIGGRVINLASRLELGGAGKMAATCVALAVSLVAAWILHRAVEIPAQKWSRHFAWKNAGVS